MVLTAQTSSEAFSPGKRKQTEQDSATGSNARRLGFVLQRAVKLSREAHVDPPYLNVPALAQQCGKCSRSVSVIPDNGVMSILSLICNT
ncbi:hypothetical protein X777_10594 [Ooceraea biroi]|uniref:Uncharacterized protein n=1 Tax=Ooceraea biroi TaxID=2015173 RepID=A0A026W5S7_OOCBI|nr:hypothetical protein X777_10594 [Ooceraea biroi]